MILIRLSTHLLAMAGITVARLIWCLPLAVLYIFLALGEMFLAPLCGALAIVCFFIAVVVGFSLSMPLQHKWELLGVSVVLMLIYFVYRGMMQIVLRMITRS